jgi:predicted nucleic acid-binding protein
VKTAVFDTNVIVAGFLSPHGPPGLIVEWLRQGVIRAVLDGRVYEEYIEVLCRPEFELDKREVERVLDIIQENAVWLRLGPDKMICDLPDADDAPFLELAREAGVALVTGNVKHFPGKYRQKTRIVTPAQWIKELGK